MAFIFVPLETISYSFRAVSLGVRLWVNMLAGHTLLHILTGVCFSWRRRLGWGRHPRVTRLDLEVLWTKERERCSPSACTSV